MNRTSRTLRERDRAATVDKAARVAAVRATLPAIVRVLVGEFGVSRVVVFGSLLRDTFDERSDLDLAVTGLAVDE